MHEATVTNDAAFVRRAVYAHWRRQHAWWEWAMLAASLASGVLMLRTDRAGWLAWVMVVAPLLVLVLWLGLGWVYRLALRDDARHMPPQAVLQSRDDALVVRHGENVVAMEWARLRRIVRRPDHWLLFWTRRDGNFSVLPLRELPAPMREHMLEQARAAGTRVR